MPDSNSESDPGSASADRSAGTQASYRLGHLTAIATKVIMSSRRATILMSALLVLACGYVFERAVKPRAAPRPGTEITEPQPLAGDNWVSGLKIAQSAAGAWTADFDYFYSGQPSRAALSIVLTPQTRSAAGANGAEPFDTFLTRPEPGRHHVNALIQDPGLQARTLKVAVVMRAKALDPVVIAQQQVDQVIDWPSPSARMSDAFDVALTREDEFKRAVQLIDSEGPAQMQEARSMLEKLIESDPHFDPAYVELARIALKTSWGPGGLHQAEGLLSSALQIHPDSSNAKILLGYVYAHQGHFAAAQKLFTAVAGAGTGNPWLWSYWAEMLTMTHQPEQAIAKYRLAIAHPIMHDSSDRARGFAYEQLLRLLKDRKDLEGMETLYRQRIAESGAAGCDSAEYIRFLLQVRGDTQGAIDLARRALDQGCTDSDSRELLGLAHYVRWSTSAGTARTDALNQARVFLPAGPRALYLLVSAARTAPAAAALMAAGEPIDQRDNQKLDALAYALQARDFAAARRLIALGAKPEAPVGEMNIPVALLPVIEDDMAAIRTLRELGVDYGNLRYRGASAFDYARMRHDEVLLEALGSKKTTL